MQCMCFIDFIFVGHQDLVTEAGAVTHLAALVAGAAGAHTSGTGPGTGTGRDIVKEACWTLSNIAAGTPLAVNL